MTIPFQFTFQSHESNSSYKQELVSEVKKEFSQRGLELHASTKHAIEASIPITTYFRSWSLFGLTDRVKIEFKQDSNGITIIYTVTTLSWWLLTMAASIAAIFMSNDFKTRLAFSLGILLVFGLMNWLIVLLRHNTYYHQLKKEIRKTATQQT